MVIWKVGVKYEFLFIEIEKVVVFDGSKFLFVYYVGWRGIINYIVFKEKYFLLKCFFWMRINNECVGICCILDSGVFG